MKPCSPRGKSPRRHTKCGTGLAAALLLLALGGSARGEWLTLYALVTNVPDGNNLRVVDKKGTVHLVRLGACDAPELQQPQGLTARTRLRELVLDQTVRIVHRFYDERGRTLGQIHVGETWVNRVLVSAGLAWYADPDNDAPELQAVESQARRQRQGLWRQSNPIPPWHWRRGARVFRPGMAAEPPPEYKRYQSSNDRPLIGVGH